jgi:hypothetical protein
MKLLWRKEGQKFSGTFLRFAFFLLLSPPLRWSVGCDVELQRNVLKVCENIKSVLIDVELYRGIV